MVFIAHYFMRFIRFFVPILVIQLFGIGACQYESQEHVNVVAHRGGIISGYPENTLLAFQRCIEIGVDYIELDLRTSRDGEIVSLHDETLDRTTNGKGLVTDFNLEELKTMDAGNGESIPTLDEVLQLVSGTDVKLLFDVKLNKILSAKQIVRTVHKNKMRSDVIYGIRSLEDLSAFHELDPDITTLGFVSDQDQISDFIENGIDIIRLKPQWFDNDSKLISRIQDRHIPVWTTVGIMSNEGLKELVSLGFTGIIYDDPDQLLKVLNP